MRLRFCCTARLLRLASPRRSASRVFASMPSSAFPPPSQPRGALLVFEGPDRSGKSTQAARLLARLQAAGHRCEGWRFPDRESESGRAIDCYLREQAGAETDDAKVHQLFSENRREKWHVLRAARVAVD